MTQKIKGRRYVLFLDFLRDIKSRFLANRIWLTWCESAKVEEARLA